MANKWHNAIESLCAELRAQGRSVTVDLGGRRHKKIIVDGQQIALASSPRDPHHAIDRTRQIIRRYDRKGNSNA